MPTAILNPIFILIVGGWIFAFPLVLGDLVRNWSSLSAWASFLFMLVIAPFAWIIVLGCLQKIIMWVRPIHFKANAHDFEFRFYNTWGNTKWSSLFSKRVNFPYNQFEAVVLSPGQGGWRWDTWIWLRHRSGSLLSTGWAGSKKAAERYADQLANWMACKRDL